MLKKKKKQTQRVSAWTILEKNQRGPTVVILVEKHLAFFLLKYGVIRSNNSLLEVNKEKYKLTKEEEWGYGTMHRA